MLLNKYNRHYKKCSTDINATNKTSESAYLLYLLNENLNLSTKLDELFEYTTSFFKNNLDIKDFCFMLNHGDNDELTISKTGSDVFDAAKDLTFKKGEEYSCIAAQTGDPLLLNDISKKNNQLFYKGKLENTGTFLSLPLQSKNNRILGLLNIHKREINAFTEEDKELLTTVALNIANTIERIELYEKAEKGAMYDDLTMLYQRKYFFDSCQLEFSKAIRHNLNFSIAMIDIDYFKYYNDTYGHLFGDEILKKLAYILKSNVRYSDIVSRYGGEEFAILLPDMDKGSATIVIDKLRETVKRILSLETANGKIECVTITAGVAAYPVDGDSVKQILSTADKYLYIGKSCGRNRVVNTTLDNQPLQQDKKAKYSALLNREEINLLLYKNVNRQINRHKTLLRVDKGINNIQFFEIKVTEDDWRICAIGDISNGGFKGELNFKPKLDEIYTCRAVVDSEVHIPAVFSIRIAHNRTIHKNRYEIGAEIVDGHNNWKRLFSLLVNNTK
ncbi:MAG: sensor domain-containing diguanylate cyclase [Candidatus Kuenenia sp.]|nr:sensor domain-containing diguanylate cyclase [Candidatus Kuenenia hertensis]